METSPLIFLLSFGVTSVRVHARVYHAVIPNGSEESGCLLLKHDLNMREQELPGRSANDELLSLLF
jgi:hypothetical protein